MYDPRRDSLDRGALEAAVRLVLAPDVVGKASHLRRIEEARGLSFDVVFSVVPLLAAEVDAFAPCIAGSAYAGRRIAQLS
ncbi:hypothetical protein CSIV_14275 [Microbacterium sp. CSI-V]|uniref:hypothetical protein n=1 Tax=Microbacterium sp. CSI-V TaxID=1933777 RepID=UPI00097BDE0B|nr:hypothetical protein [Microbacterium sp. CSI-V]ONI62637.1 hypothetical protein CSIV_14275 [Microbacterium sp. CSI-V]